jgi:uncharacterized protein
MIKKAWVLGVVVLTACVTVNVYFPAAAVRQAADEIVEETWGKQPKPAGPAGQTQLIRNIDLFEAYVWLGFLSEAHAQEADINISNPPIRAIKERLSQRSGQLKPFLSKKNVGIDKNGYLEVLNTEGISLKERSMVNQLVTAENRDRKDLYAEIAKANNLSGDAAKIEKIFADSWRDKAQSGWQIQKNDGTWATK